MAKTSNSHRFALYVSELSDVVLKAKKPYLSFKNKELFNRMVTILHLRAGENVVLFDQSIQIYLTLDPAMFKDRNEVIGTFLGPQIHTPLTPVLNLAVGLTKREAFAEIAYLACQMGVTTLIPLITDKTQREWSGDKEHQKLFATMVAAAEQSKNFVFSTIEQPQTIQNFMKNPAYVTGFKAFCEAGGKPFIDLLHSINAARPLQITLIIGPEGGLTSKEQIELEANTFTKFQLTPTVLRSVEAVAVSVGAIRSCVRYQ